MPLATFIGKQAASPSGLFGQFLMTRILNRVNINMNRFALDRADLSTGEYLLELGCGGGDLAQRALKKSDCGYVMGIDASVASIKHCNRRLRRAVHAQRACFKLAKAEQIPIADASYTCVISSSTVYFFSDLKRVMLECQRVLKADGKMVLCFNDARWLRRQSFARQGFRSYEVAEIESLLESSGFGKISTEQRRDSLQGLIHCTIASRS
jgi:cyclopropane fatty-acyl-phospholipid synthase-like methyltransferase